MTERRYLAKLLNTAADKTPKSLGLTIKKKYVVDIYFTRNMAGLLNDNGHYIELPAACFSIHDAIDLESKPTYKDNKIVEVGHKVKRAGTDVIKEIIRIDTSTRQVWFRSGGFEWFEDMKNYSEV